jgi:DNA-binding NarL/FixJ family response regulator
MKRDPPIDGQTLVLVVEDEPLIRIFTVQVLTEAGFEVEEAGNSGEALSRLNGRTINALVTDVDMPGRLDGCGLAWKSMPFVPEPPWLFQASERHPLGNYHQKPGFCENRWHPRNLWLN